MKKIFLLFLFLTGMSYTQQIGDPDFNPTILNPAYPPGEGSKIYIDEAHNNFHTMDGRYKPFADLLARDGYIVSPLKDSFSQESLKNVDILVISNALNTRNTEDWTLPTPSAFTNDEINYIASWVENGGSIFLIADHMPFPGAAEEMAKRFGFKSNNGYALDTTGTGTVLYIRSDGTLGDNIITDGRNEQEKVDSIYWRLNPH